MKHLKKIITYRSKIIKQFREFFPKDHINKVVQRKNDFHNSDKYQAVRFNNKNMTELKPKRKKLIQQSQKATLHTGKQKSKTSRNISETKLSQSNQLFSSKRIIAKIQKKNEDQSIKQQSKNSTKGVMSDESNPCIKSQVEDQPKRYMKKMPNQQYFQIQVPKKNRKKIQPKEKSSRNSSGIKDFSFECKKIQQITKKQQKQLKKVIGSISQKQLNRLIKIQSIQKMKIFEKIQSSKTPKKRKRC